jgi:tetratricopeptide (TPR) repeat protein
MKIKVMKKALGILIVSTILSYTGNAQDRNDVIKVYNEGAKASQTDIPAAIKSFEQVVSIADQVGETAADLKEKATKILPGLYFKNAYNSLTEKKPAQETIEAAKAAIAASEKYGNTSYKENSQKVLLQAYNSLGSEYFAGNEYDKALAVFDSALAISPGYTTAVYNKALIYIKQDNANEFEKAIDQVIESLKSTKEEDKADQASKMALEYFRGAGSRASQEDKLDDALSLLARASKYGEDKDLYYYYADVYNKQKDFGKAAESAQKGLDLETGDAEAKAKFYFQLGLAQAGLGQKSEACGSFKDAGYGAFVQASKAERTNLKCE